MTDAIYDAGFSGPSRFYDNMEGRMGMTASAWVNGGKGVTIHWAVVPTSLGAMLVAATAKGVCRLSVAEGRAALEERFPAANLVEGGEEFEALLSQVIAAVEATSISPRLVGTTAQWIVAPLPPPTHAEAVIPMRPSIF